MKTKILYGLFLSFVFISVLLVTGCKKTTTASTTTSYKIKSIISTSTSGSTVSIDTQIYLYDTLGRVSMKQASNGSVTFMITGNSIAIDLSSLGYVISFTGTLSSSGLIKQVTQPTMGTMPAIYYYYRYDNNNELLVDSSVNDTGNPSVMSTFTWSDSNLISVTSANYSGATTVIANYSYTYLNTREYRENGFSSQLNGGYTVGIIGGRNSKNLIDTETYMQGSTTRVYNHSYTFDKKGRVATETVSTVGGMNVFAYTYY